MEKLSFKLEVFEGPLDLLLFLIQKNKVSIYDIPISIITEQYMEYLKERYGVNINMDDFTPTLLLPNGHYLYKYTPCNN